MNNSKTNELESQVKALIEIHREDRDRINKLEKQIQHYESLINHYKVIVENIKSINLNIEVIQDLEDVYIDKTSYDDLPDSVKNEIKRVCKW